MTMTVVPDVPVRLCPQRQHPPRTRRGQEAVCQHPFRRRFRYTSTNIFGDEKYFSGYAKLDRSTLSVLMIIIIFTILASANFKIME